MLGPGDTIGIVGGGQLGRMLAMSAARLGMRIVILDPQEDAPAFQCATERIVAAYDDTEALAELASRVSAITYEFENVPVKALRQLDGRIALYPGLSALETSQDRLLEKTFFNEFGIHTAPFSPVGSLKDLEASHNAFGGKSILKTRRLGYDGKGQVRLDGSNNKKLAEAEKLVSSTDCILEQVVDFDCEVSVIACRDQHGNIVAFDPARNVHREGILRTSTVPANVDDATSELAIKNTKTILEKLDYVGTIGVEWFVMPDGEILANEFAPRVHNSGHWTEAACSISQFDLHIRAVSELPLPTPCRHSDCVMTNIIGHEIDEIEMSLNDGNTFLHLYGKSETRAGRKMGHYTKLSPKT